MLLCHSIHLLDQDQLYCRSLVLAYIPSAWLVSWSMLVQNKAKYEYSLCEELMWKRVRLTWHSNGIAWLRSCVRTVTNCGSLVYMQKCVIVYLHGEGVERTLWTVHVYNCYHKCKHTKYDDYVFVHTRTYRNGSCAQKNWPHGFFIWSTYRFEVVNVHRWIFSLTANTVNVYKHLHCPVPLGRKFFYFFLFFS